MSDNITQSPLTTDTAYLGNGCFWCTEAIFQQVPGVLKVTSGYSGGQTPDPDYNAVCSGTTGHAECLAIEYDPQTLSFEILLSIFWQTHDPTTLNQQGNDIGTQYRSVIFYRNENEQKIAATLKEKLAQSKIFNRPIVTTLEPFSQFFPAENYHQDYYNLHKSAPYCQLVIRPKLDKFKQILSHISKL